MRVGLMKMDKYAIAGIEIPLLKVQIKKDTKPALNDFVSFISICILNF
jgi:hypothetical protein